LRALFEHSRRAEPGWQGPEFDVEPHRDELDIRDVDGSPRAFNVSLWDQLQAAARKVAREELAAKRPDAGGATANRKAAKKTVSPSPDPEAVRQLWSQWWRNQLAERLRGKLTKPLQAKASRLFAALLTTELGSEAFRESGPMSDGGVIAKVIQ
jgi:hypothetical protein